MNILALESSATACSAALCRDGALIAQSFQNSGLTHSRTLLPMVNDLLKNCGETLEGVDVIAVAAGPGSFTGLRIGSATAKGLAFAMEKPIVPVPTLEGLAYQMYGTDALVCPIMDARRNQVYTGLYEFRSRSAVCAVEASGFLTDMSSLEREKETVSSVAGQDKAVSETAEHRYDMRVVKTQCAVSFDEIAQEINRIGRKVVFVGDGIPVFRDRMAEVLQVPYTLAPAHRNRQSAACIAALGGIYYAQGRAVSGAEHVPEYLRLSQAERERAGSGGK